jgi:hypothetical protein
MRMTELARSSLIGIALQGSSASPATRAPSRCAALRCRGCRSSCPGDQHQRHQRPSLALRTFGDRTHARSFERGPRTRHPSQPYIRGASSRGRRAIHLEHVRCGASAKHRKLRFQSDGSVLHARKMCRRFTLTSVTHVIQLRSKRGPSVRRGAGSAMAANRCVAQRLRSTEQALGSDLSGFRKRREGRCRCCHGYPRPRPAVA